MSRKKQEQLLGILLLSGRGNARLWAASVALFSGTFLLLAAVLIWSDFNSLLRGGSKRESLASSYLIIGKKVTDNNMADPHATLFSDQEINDLKTAPQVEEVGIIQSNTFPVYAMMGGNLGFATELPLESVDDHFLDIAPKDWSWQPGSPDLPIILSTQFLDIYNYVFAPSQNLPRLSESTVKSLVLRLKIGNDQNGETLMAHVVGFSDRIVSVLAPKAFIDYGNQKYGAHSGMSGPSQIILKAHDPSDTKFSAYLDAHSYNTSGQNLRWNKIRGVVDIIIGALGGLALLLLGIGTLVVLLFVELTIVRARNSVTLLLDIGYSPAFMSKFLSSKFLPFCLVANLAALVAILLIQLLSSMALSTYQSAELPLLPGAAVWLAFVGCTLLQLGIIRRSVTRSLNES